MKQKTILRDQFGCMSMIRWFLLVMLILAGLQIISGLIISFMVVWRNKPDFIPLVIGLISGSAIETLVGMIGKVIQKNIEISNISAKEYIEKKLTGMDNEE